jgi:hypothetical protein
MAPKRLPKRIEDLSYAIGKPEPHPGYFKGELVNILASVKELENGEAVREAETQIAALETALEKANTENANLKAKLNAAKAEIETFRAAEREKQEEERKKDLPDAQVELLRILEPERLGLMKVSEILDRISVREDEAVWHLNKLKELQLADFTHHAIGYEMWYRTELGNTEVIARRMAARGDLPDIAEKILAELSPPGREPGRVGVDMTAAGIALLLDIPEDLALKYLERLRAAEYAIRAYKRTGMFWSRHPDGTAYLEAKRAAGGAKRGQTNKHDDLPEMQHAVLLQVSALDGAVDTDIAAATGQNLAGVRSSLRLLKEKEMVMSKYEDTGEGCTDAWYLLAKGEEYLAERNLL